MSVAMFVLGGCATQEYLRAESACRSEWSARIPENIQPRVVDETRYEERFTGETVCTTTKNQVSCVQKTKTVPVTHQVLKNVDLNAPKRNRAINACAADLCLEHYGNAECKS